MAKPEHVHCTTGSKNITVDMNKPQQLANKYSNEQYVVPILTIKFYDAVTKIITGNLQIPKVNRMISNEDK